MPAAREGPRVLWVAPALPTHDQDPLLPYWAGMAATVARGAALDLIPLRFPSGTRPYPLGAAKVHPLAYGHRRLRRSPALWLGAIHKALALHARRPFHLVHALHGNEAGWIAALIARRLRLPLIVHLGGGEMADLPRQGYGSQGLALERWQVRVATRTARRIGVGSLRLLGLARATLPERSARRLRLMPIGLDLAPFLAVPPRRRQGGWQPALIQVADLNAVKDQPGLLAAFEPWARAMPSLRLHIVGGGPMARQLLGSARELGVDGQVRFWGQVPNHALPAVLARADAYVHASLHEAQGLALIEAAAAGLPVASTSVGVAPELPAMATHLAEPGDGAGLRRAIGRALAAACDPARAADCRARQRRAALRFSLTETAATWLGAYAELAGR